MRSKITILPAVLTLACIMETAAIADDGFGTSPPRNQAPVNINLSRWEIRGGGLLSTWGPEKGQPYFNAEIIAPKFFRLEGPLDFLVPRLRAGAMANLAGGTSYFDAGGSGRSATSDTLPTCSSAAQCTTDKSLATTSTRTGISSAAASSTTSAGISATRSPSA